MVVYITNIAHIMLNTKGKLEERNLMLIIKKLSLMKIRFWQVYKGK